MSISSGPGGPLPFLDVSGVEVANAARTLAYLRAGLGDTRAGHWEIGEGNPCSVLYRPFGTPLTFVSPQSDPAPWYDATEAGSKSFLGVVLLDIKGYDSANKYRNVTSKIQGLGGAVVSAQRRKERVWQFRAAMVSNDDSGAEYGLRWLSHILQAPACAVCSLGSLRVWLVCPPDDGSNDVMGEWTSYDVALTAGPNVVAPYTVRSQAADSDVLAGCRDYYIVEWTMTAANPYMYRPSVPGHSSPITIGTTAAGCGIVYGAPGGFYLGSVDLASDDYETALGQPGPPVCTAVTKPKMGTVAPVFTFVSTSGMGEVFLEAHASCAVTSDTPVLQMLLENIPAASTVVVNCATRKVTVTTASVTTDGGYLIGVAPGASSIEWLELNDCDTGIGCFCARTANACSGGIDTTVQIATQYRDM